jgi:predicted phage-related endonuclease
MNMLHIVKPDQTYVLIEEYRDLDRQIKALEKKKKEIGDELKAGYFLSNTDYVVEGRLIATYREEIQVRLDQTRFKEELPEVFKEYQTLVPIKKFLLK